MRRIDSNLAREPFLNRKIPVAVAGTLVALALAATVANLVLFVLRGGEYRGHHAQRAQQQERLASLDRELAHAQKLLSGREVEQYAAEAAFASGLLERRRFSWTRFLERVESVKPYGVLLSDLTPAPKSDGTLEVRLRGAANAREEILKFEKNLLDSPFFGNPQLETEEKDAGGALTRFSIRADYVPGGRP